MAGAFILRSICVFLLAVTLLFVTCHLWAMDLYSKQIEISFFFFITAGIYVTCFNAERQAVACAIYALAVGPLIKGNFKKYLGWVLVASLFHQTALVAIQPILSCADRLLQEIMQSSH